MQCPKCEHIAAEDDCFCPKCGTALERPLRDYIARYPKEDLARVVRVYLAWVLIQKRELSEARALADAARTGPAGSVRDFAVVTEAAILIRLGSRPAAAAAGQDH